MPSTGTSGQKLQDRNFRTGTLDNKNVRQPFQDRTLIKKLKGGSRKRTKEIFIRTGSAGQTK